MKQPLVRQTIGLISAVLIGLLVYGILLASPVGRTIDILFYRGCLLAVVAGLISGALGHWLGRRLDTALLALPAALTTASLAVCFLVLFPVTFDRSISVYLLATIDAHQRDGIDARQLKTAFINGYVGDLHAIDRRIVEQMQSGNLRVARDGRLGLTAQGTRFVATARRAATLFGTDPRIVAGRVR